LTGSGRINILIREADAAGGSHWNDNRCPRRDGIQPPYRRDHGDPV